MTAAVGHILGSAKSFLINPTSSQITVDQTKKLTALSGGINLGTNLFSGNIFNLDNLFGILSLGLLLPASILGAPVAAGLMAVCLTYYLGKSAVSLGKAGASLLSGDFKGAAANLFYAGLNAIAVLPMGKLKSAFSFLKAKSMVTVPLKGAELGKLAISSVDDAAALGKMAENVTRLTDKYKAAQETAEALGKSFTRAEKELAETIGQTGAKGVTNDAIKAAGTALQESVTAAEKVVAQLTDDAAKAAADAALKAETKAAARLAKRAKQLAEQLAKEKATLATALKNQKLFLQQCEKLKFARLAHKKSLRTVGVWNELLSNATKVTAEANGGILTQKMLTDYNDTLKKVAFSPRRFMHVASRYLYGPDVAIAGNSMARGIKDSAVGFASTAKKDGAGAAFEGLVKSGRTKMSGFWQRTSPTPTHSPTLAPTTPIEFVQNPNGSLLLPKHLVSSAKRPVAAA